MSGWPPAISQHYLMNLKFTVELAWYSSTLDPQAAYHPSPHHIMATSINKYSFGMLTW